MTWGYPRARESFSAVAQRCGAVNCAAHPATAPALGMLEAYEQTEKNALGRAQAGESKAGKQLLQIR